MTGAPYALHMLSETLILVRYNTMLVLWNKGHVQRQLTFQHELVDSAVSGHLLFISTFGKLYFCRRDTGLWLLRKVSVI